jgi:hypothetical protein
LCPPLKAFGGKEETEKRQRNRQKPAYHLYE